jgi:hypothetical protein
MPVLLYDGAGVGDKIREKEGEGGGGGREHLKTIPLYGGAGVGGKIRRRLRTRTEDGTTLNPASAKELLLGDRSVLLRSTRATKSSQKCFFISFSISPYFSFLCFVPT